MPADAARTAGEQEQTQGRPCKGPQQYQIPSSRWDKAQLQIGDLPTRVVDPPLATETQPDEGPAGLSDGAPGPLRADDGPQLPDHVAHDRSEYNIEYSIWYDMI